MTVVFTATLALDTSRSPRPGPITVPLSRRPRHNHHPDRPAPDAVDHVVDARRGLDAALGLVRIVEGESELVELRLIYLEHLVDRLLAVVLVRGIGAGDRD